MEGDLNKGDDRTWCFWTQATDESFPFVDTRWSSLWVQKEQQSILPYRYHHYDMWVGRALILLGDAFKKEGDFFNAKATWNGVIENFDVAELVAIAKEKLAQLAKEQQASKIK